MDRRLIFPAVAITAWAQQPSPAAAEAEAALRARVDQFYQLQIDKKYRQAEAFVAEDTKDDYYNSSKSRIKTESIEKIELLDDNSRAKVTVKRKVVVATPLGDQDFDMLAPSTWKLENGQWVWYIDHNAPIQTPFGPIARLPVDSAKGPVGQPPSPGKVDVATLMKQISVDTTAVVLNSVKREQTVTISNDLPGAIHLDLRKPQLEGVTVELEKMDLKSGEKGAIRFRSAGDATASGVVTLIAYPLNEAFEISVQSN
jgi:hypothetical protein